MTDGKTKLKFLSNDSRLETFREHLKTHKTYENALE